MFILKKFEDIKKEFDLKINSHSYMFYTNDFFSCQKDVNNLIKSIFEVDNINIIESDFFKVTKSDKKNILKDDISKLKTFFQNTSYINDYRIYLIEEAHKLNSSSANLILKFLEEPSKGIVAFFITTNLDSVLTTIRSRCQIINVFYDNINDDLINSKSNVLKDFLYDNNKYFSIIKVKKEFEKYDRSELIILFKDFLETCYKDVLNKNNMFLIKKINKCISMLNNNVNVDYVFDYLLLGSGDKFECS